MQVIVQDPKCLLIMCHSYYLCNWNGESWDDAMNHCNSAHGTLLTAENVKEIDLSEIIRENVTEFWTSNIIEVAHAVEYKGCYVYSTIQTQNNPDITGKINLVDCQSACTNKYDINLFHGLHDNKCVCILNEVQLKFDPSNQSCFKNCSINSLEFCKDSKLIALYKTLSNNRTLLQEDDVVNNKCVVRVNTNTDSTENCKKNLQYQCKGKINNGTFLKALEDCGKDLNHGNETINISGLSWKPVFFPTLDRIKIDQFNTKQKTLKMKICKSLKVGEKYTFLRERNCTDTLPYVCKTDSQKTNSTYVKTCLFQFRQTSTLSLKTQLFSTSNHASTMSVSSVDTIDTSSDIHYASTLLYVRNSTVQSCNSTESVASAMSKKPLIIGIVSGASALIFPVIIIFILRKRLTGTKQKNESCQSHSYYLCNWKDESWDRATKHCSFAYGKLLRTDNFKQDNLLELIRTNFTEFWTSNIIEVAHAVEYKGCFLYSSRPTQTLLTPAEGGINLVDCQSACNNNYDIYPFYGLYGNSCVCIYNSEQLTPLSQSCFENCSIKSLEFCKDSKVIALYQRISYNRRILQEDNVINNKCVVRVNRTTDSTENCQKNLQYQCKGTIQNGTFLKAIEDCGKDFGHGNEPTNILALSWKPVFFPTLDRIKRIKIQLKTKQKSLKMMICKSLKVDGNHTYLKERNCTDSLPYICTTEDQNTNTAYLKTCQFRIRQTSSPTMKTQLIPTRRDNHASTFPDTRGITLEKTSDISYTSTLSYTGDSTVQSSNSTESVASEMSKKPLIIGTATGASMSVLTVIIIIIFRQRLTRTKKKNENCLHTVHLEAVYENMKELDYSSHQIQASDSQTVYVNVAFEPNRRNNVYEMTNKAKQTDCQKGDDHIYAVLNKNGGKVETNAGNYINFAKI